MRIGRLVHLGSTRSISCSSNLRRTARADDAMELGEPSAPHPRLRAPEYCPACQVSEGEGKSTSCVDVSREAGPALEGHATAAGGTGESLRKLPLRDDEGQAPSSSGPGRGTSRREGISGAGRMAELRGAGREAGSEEAEEGAPQPHVAGGTGPSPSSSPRRAHTTDRTRLHVCVGPTQASISAHISSSFSARPPGPGTQAREGPGASNRAPPSAAR